MKIPTWCNTSLCNTFWVYIFCCILLSQEWTDWLHSYLCSAFLSLGLASQTKISRRVSTFPAGTLMTCQAYAGSTNPVAVTAVEGVVGIWCRGCSFVFLPLRQSCAFLRRWRLRSWWFDAMCCGFLPVWPIPDVWCYRQQGNFWGSLCIVSLGLPCFGILMLVHQTGWSLAIDGLSS